MTDNCHVISTPLPALQIYLFCVVFWFDSILNVHSVQNIWRKVGRKSICTWNGKQWGSSGFTFKGVSFCTLGLILERAQFSDSSKGGRKRWCLTVTDEEEDYLPLLQKKQIFSVLTIISLTKYTEPAQLSWQLADLKTSCDFKALNVLLSSHPSTLFPALSNYDTSNLKAFIKRKSKYLTTICTLLIRLKGCGPDFFKWLVAWKADFKKLHW